MTWDDVHTDLAAARIAEFGEDIVYSAERQVGRNTTTGVPTVLPVFGFPATIKAQVAQEEADAYEQSVPVTRRFTVMTDAFAALAINPTRQDKIAYKGKTYRVQSARKIHGGRMWQIDAGASL